MYVTTSQSERKLLQPLKEFGIYFEIISATLVLKVSWLLYGCSWETQINDSWLDA